MNLAINDRRTFNLTALFVVLGALFGVLVALVSVQISNQVSDDVIFLDRGEDGVIVLLQGNDELSSELEAALEKIRKLKRLQDNAPIPADNRAIMPPKPASSGTVFIDI